MRDARVHRESVAPHTLPFRAADSEGLSQYDDDPTKQKQILGLSQDRYGEQAGVDEKE